MDLSSMSLDLADTSTFQREWTLLLECASPFTDPTRFTDLAKTVDWPRLLFLADEHGLVGHVTAVLQKLNAGAIPAQVTKDLLDRQRAQALSSLRMTAELFRILEQFAAAGVRALAVKGPVLSVQAYGDPAMRSYGDLDLLVPHRDIRSATELMLASGYEARVSLKAIGAGKIPGQYLFCKPDSKLLVELHNDRTLRYFPRPLPMEQFFARRIRVPLDAREAPALCVEDELILISIHGAKHFWERLIWIADVAALMTRQSSLDWERVLATAEELRATRMLYTGLQLAVDLLKARLPEAIRAKTKGDHVAAQLARQIFNWLPAAGNAPPGLMERALFRVRMRGGLFSGPTYLLRLSLSPTEEDWRAKDQQTTSHFLDALRRPFRLARKHSSGRNP